MSSWRCQEADEDDMPIDFRWNPRRLYPKPSRSKLRDLKPHEILKRASQEWQRTVESYTSRNLTISTDCLPSISGIAEQFSHRMGDSAYYAAGLWSSTMLQDLLWHNRYSEPIQRPVRYQAPSWSWASVNNRVKFALKLANPRRQSSVATSNWQTKGYLVSILGSAPSNQDG